ncbi:MAG: class I SAM-dependent methyltransferase [Pseudonocardiaceae bacterium]
MSGIGARLLEAGFGRPRGLLGRVGGWLMARGNAETERQLVQLAGLEQDEVVLVLGHGPGIGLRAAGKRSGQVIGIDPSALMREAAGRRCGELIRQGRVRLASGVAQDTGLPDATVDVVLTVNNVALWPDWPAGFAELHRVLRPGGRMLLSAHEKWLPGGQAALTAAVDEAGFSEVQTWTWEPPGRGATTAVQLRAHRPPR